MAGFRTRHEVNKELDEDYEKKDSKSLTSIRSA